MKPVRNPVPEDLQDDVTILGFEDYRIWAHHSPRDLKKVMIKSLKQQAASGVMYDKNGKI